MEEAVLSKEDVFESASRMFETAPELAKAWMWALKLLEKQNASMREALDRIDYLSKYYAAKLSCHMDKETMEPLKLDPIAQEFADIVRETLAKVGEHR